MDSKLVLLVLLVLGISFLFSGAEVMDSYDMTVAQANNENPVIDVKIVEVNWKNERLCILCEEFATQAVNYLSQNMTQTEIIDVLHLACSQLKPFQQQCMLLVDYYAPLLFLEIGSLDPELFCTKVDLCGYVIRTPQIRVDDTCGICNDAISEILNKLEDPETELEIIQALLQLCNKVEQYTQQCKNLIFEYGPVILVNAGKYLEKMNFCKLIHACKETKDGYVADLAKDI